MIVMMIIIIIAHKHMNHADLLTPFDCNDDDAKSDDYQHHT